jgi:predicted dehydrogenase
MTQRRDFIKNSVLGSAGVAFSGLKFDAKSYRSIIGANDRLNVAVVGIRGQGTAHIENWCGIKDSHNVKLKTLCDTDEQYFAEKSKIVQDKTGVTPVTEWDLRKVFDDKEIDAVSFAIPNHWHALATIWACQAGKHVYVEKPASHNLFEGRKMIDAARKYKVRVQVGFQNRSIPNVMEAMDFLHKGGIGDVYMARGLCIKPRDSFGKVPNSQPPATLHYDQWLGPAPTRPYNEKHVHYNWHWFWVTGNGDTGNQGPHQFDIARWGINKNEHPVSVYSSGGYFGIDPKDCDQETPNTQSSILKYADGKIIEFETRGRFSNGESSLNTSIGNIFYGSDGYLELDGETWKAFRKREKEPFAGSEKKENREAELNSHVATNGALHWMNFVDAIRAGDDSKLHCQVKEGFYSTALPLLSNISYRLGRALTFSGEKEKFVNDHEADALTTRVYRKPFVVPNEV